MAEERVIILDVQTADAAKSINDLKSNISTLTKTLSGLDIGTDDYNKTVIALAKNQQRLRDVNSEIAASIKGVTTQISANNSVTEDAIESQESQINTIRSLRGEITTLSDSLVSLDQESDAYNATLDEIREKQDQLNRVMVATANGGVKRLRAEINYFREELGRLTPGTEEYSQVLAEVANRTRDLNDLNLRVRTSAADLSQVLGNIVSVGGGVASGFSSVRAATALLGVESDALAQTLVKLQASIALVQGLKGLEGLTKTIPALIAGVRGLTASTIALRSALISTGIGALVVAVGVLAANFDKLTGAFQKNREELKRLNDEYSFFKTQTDYLRRESNVQIQIMRIQRASEEEIFAERRKLIDDDYQRLIELRRKYGMIAEKDLDEQSKKEKQQIEDALAANRQAFLTWEGELRVYRARAAQNEIDEEEEKNKKILEDAQRAAQERENVRQSELKQITDINKQVSDANLSRYEIDMNNLRENYEQQLALFERNKDDIQDYDNVVLDLTEKYYSDLQKIVDSENERISTENLNRYNKDIEDFQLRNEQVLDKQRVFLSELEAQRLEYELAGDQEGVEETQARINELMELQEEQNIKFLEDYRGILQQILGDETILGEDRINIQREADKLSNDILLAGLESRLKALRGQRDAEKKILDERKAQEKAYYDNTVTLLNAASDILGQNTAEGKALAIAAATISTYKAATDAMANTPGGPIAKAIALASTIATGIATVKKIVAVDVPGTSSDVSPALTSEAVSIPKPIVEDRQEIEIDRNNYGINSTEEQIINSTRVYVVESDISETVNRVRLAESEATF